MSAYFARLARRSGAIAFGVPRGQPATDSPGIVEQETFIEASSSSPVASSAAPARAASATNEPAQAASATPVPAAASPRESVPVTAPTTSARVSPASAPPSQAGRAVAPTRLAPPAERRAPKTEVASTQAAMPAAVNANVPPEASVAAASRPTLRHDGSAAVRTKAAARGEAQTPGSATASATARTHPRETASPSPTIAPASPFIEPREARPTGAAERMPVQARVERMRARMEPNAPAYPVPAREQSGSSSGLQIDVHIGAVRLEIHGPAVPTPAPITASAPTRAAEERPRFAPRRYYLRG